jgi:hypothetical protein
MMRLLLLVAGCTLIVGGADPRDGVDASIGHPCADVTSDPHNCGACGRDCTSLPGVDPGAVHCTAGQCDIRNACAPGRADCGGGYIDGCESDLSSADHCGNCFSICGGDAALCTRTTGGLYTCTGSCPPGTMQCGSSCIDLLNDAQHCGSCTHVCPTTTGQVGVCQNGICSSQCAGGFHACSGVCVDSTSLDTCGTRCTPCPAAPANGTPVCDPFAGCDYQCNAGFTKSLGSCVQNMTFDMATPADLTSVLTCIPTACMTDADCPVGCTSCNTLLGICF